MNGFFGFIGDSIKSFFSDLFGGTKPIRPNAPLFHKVNTAFYNLGVVEDNITPYIVTGPEGAVYRAVGGRIMTRALLDEIARRRAAIALSPESVGRSFKSMSAFRRAMGPAGPGMEWEHLVEQCQIGKSGFAPEAIYNELNTIALPKVVHSFKTAAYNTNVTVEGLTMRFRNSLVGDSFKSQYNTGLDILEAEIKRRLP